MASLACVCLTGWPVAWNWRPLSCQRMLAFLFHIGSVTARHSSSGRQPNFAAFSRGRHLYSVGRPSRCASAHILVYFVLIDQHCVKIVKIGTQRLEINMVSFFDHTVASCYSILDCHRCKSTWNRPSRSATNLYRWKWVPELTIRSIVI